MSQADFIFQTVTNMSWLTTTQPAQAQGALNHCKAAAESECVEMLLSGDDTPEKNPS